MNRRLPAAPLLVALLVAPVSSSAEVKTVRLWPGVPPGSNGITEKEKVVERGNGKTVVDRSESHIVENPALSRRTTPGYSAVGKTRLSDASRCGPSQ